MKIMIKLVPMLLLLSLLLCGCRLMDAIPTPGVGNANPGDGKPTEGQPSPLEVGFTISGNVNASVSMPGYIGYGSYASDFYIDNVTLYFYFGEVFFDDLQEILKTRSYPTFRICFSDDNGNEYFIREVNENYISEKYRCTVTYDEKYNISRINYNHAEKVTIPREIFTEETGIIYFKLVGVNVMNADGAEETINSTGICYKVVENRVYLSNRFFD